ncbi:hypothetical protein E2C01_092410 [Portunus trituberculatus]|uniref:Ig-like domain-containing protein n=1 Tax=Portunus trituberculatus TaxID=210409 RepID=A0A5B7JVE1_PORTR|nr:hypothetical protein [Portunus trituberculatus]
MSPSLPPWPGAAASPALTTTAGGAAGLTCTSGGRPPPSALKNNVWLRAGDGSPQNGDGPHLSRLSKPIRCCGAARGAPAPLYPQYYCSLRALNSICRAPPRALLLCGVKR